MRPALVPWNSLYPLVCSKCRVPKAREDYATKRNQRTPDRTCLDCRLVHLEEWLSENQHRAREARAEWNARNPELKLIYQRRTAANRRALTLPHATHHKQEWTGAELEVADRRHLSGTEAALMLGRTAKAVHHARARIDARDPRTLSKLGYDPSRPRTHDQPLLTIPDARIDALARLVNAWQEADDHARQG